MDDFFKFFCKVLNRLLDAGRDGFEGGLSTRKYMGIAKTSRATAWRELDDLLQKGMLRPLEKGGRSTAYEMNWSLEGANCGNFVGTRH